MKTYKEANQVIFETVLADKDSAGESLHAALIERIEEKRSEMKKRVAQNLFTNNNEVTT
jgi:5S rRNA maturation endonuclease (ribonuclease M5)